MDNYNKINIGNNIEYINKLKHCYITILISSYIVKLCQVKMKLKGAKKVFLLCPGSKKENHRLESHCNNFR